MKPKEQSPPYRPWWWDWEDGKSREKQGYDDDQAAEERLRD